MLNIIFFLIIVKLNLSNNSIEVASDESHIGLFISVITFIESNLRIVGLTVANTDIKIERIIEIIDGAV